MAGIPAARIVLVGLMGAGKSTIGSALAASLGWPYIDNDTVVEEITGINAHELLAQRGEGALRVAEHDALWAVLDRPPPLVAGAAAGVVLEDDARRRLRDDAFTVWLHPDPAVIAQRVMAGGGRPWLDADVASVIRRMEGERSGLYATVAQLTVDSSRPVADVVAEITAAAGLTPPAP